MSAPAVSIALTGSDQQVVTGPGFYAGFAIRETAAGAAVIRIFDGTDTSGVLIDQITLTANGDSRAYYEDGVKVNAGIFVKVVSGAVAGSLRTL